MTQGVSSAEPEKLFQFAKRGRWITFHLEMESSQLANHLQRFENLCTEPAYRIHASYLADHVRNFGAECRPIDDWVDRVGKEFLLADQSKLSTETLPNICVENSSRMHSTVPESVLTPTPANDNSAQNTTDTIEVIHTALDIVGFIPVFGEIADGVNGIIYLAEGRKVEASISFLSMIPLKGDIIFKGGKYAYKGGDRLVKRTAKSGLEEATEQSVKKNVDEFLKFGNLPVNTTIKRNGYEYSTDHLGRTQNVSGKLRLETGSRTTHQTEVGHLGLPRDEGGHLIGTRFDGPAEGFNIVPQDSNLNRGAWKTMENEWADALQAGKEVKVDIMVRYVDDTLRPEVFEVRYLIDGSETARFFKNISGGG
jgi:hypothetical protein